MGNIEHCIERSLDEMNRILAADGLEHERCGDESHEHFVVRKVLEASGMPDQLRGAVEALRDLAAEVEFAFPASVDRRGLRQALDRAHSIIEGQ